MTDTTPDDMVVTPPLADVGMTPAEAAALLGISERTVQRRLRQGLLQGYKVDAGRGEVWRVILEGVVVTPPEPHVVMVTTATEPTTQDVMPSEPDVTSSSVVEFAHAVIDELRDEYRDQIDRLQRENQQLAGQLGFMQAKVQEQERQIQLLMAPKDEPNDTGNIMQHLSEVEAEAREAATRTALAEAERDRLQAELLQRRPWWRRFFS